MWNFRRKHYLSEPILISEWEEWTRTFVPCDTWLSDTEAGYTEIPPWLSICMNLGSISIDPSHSISMFQQPFQFSHCPNRASSLPFIVKKLAIFGNIRHAWPFTFSQTSRCVKLSTTWNVFASLSLSPYISFSIKRKVFSLYTKTTLILLRSLVLRPRNYQELVSIFLLSKSCRLCLHSQRNYRSLSRIQQSWNSWVVGQRKKKQLLDSLVEKLVCSWIDSKFPFVTCFGVSLSGSLRDASGKLSHPPKVHKKLFGEQEIINTATNNEGMKRIQPIKCFIRFYRKGLFHCTFILIVTG